MSPTMILVLALIAVPLTAQDPGAGRLERLTQYAQELGFEVEEVWTSRDGRISMRLRPGPPPAPPAPETPPAPPVIDADAGSYMEALTQTVHKFGVAEKVKIGPPRVRGSKDGATTAIRIDFLMKEGYHYDDVVRLLQAIEDQHPRARLRSLDLGKRDPGPMMKVWRPTLAEFVLEPKPLGASALVHLGELNGAAERLRSVEVEVVLDRFRADDRGLKWDMTVKAAALPAELFATIGASLPGGAVLPGRISCPSPGLWDISGSSIAFEPR